MTKQMKTAVLAVQNNQAINQIPNSVRIVVYNASTEYVNQRIHDRIRWRCFFKMLYESVGIWWR